MEEAKRSTPPECWVTPGLLKTCHKLFSLAPEATWLMTSLNLANLRQELLVWQGEKELIFEDRHKMLKGYFMA